MSSKLQRAFLLPAVAVLLAVGCGRDSNTTESGSTATNGGGNGETSDDGGGDLKFDFSLPDMLPGDACVGSDECPTDAPHCLGPIECLEMSCRATCDAECFAVDDIRGVRCLDDGSCCAGLVCGEYGSCEPAETGSSTGSSDVTTGSTTTG